MKLAGAAALAPFPPGDDIFEDLGQRSVGYWFGQNTYGDISICWNGFRIGGYDNHRRTLCREVSSDIEPACAVKKVQVDQGDIYPAQVFDSVTAACGSTDDFIAKASDCIFRRRCDKEMILDDEDLIGHPRVLLHEPTTLRGDFPFQHWSSSQPLLR